MMRALREQGPCFFVGHRRMDDDIFTLFPVHWRGDTIFIADLEGWYGKSMITGIEIIPYNQ